MSKTSGGQSVGFRTIHALRLTLRAQPLSASFRVAADVRRLNIFRKKTEPPDVGCYEIEVRKSFSRRPVAPTRHAEIRCRRK